MKPTPAGSIRFWFGGDRWRDIPLDRYEAALAYMDERQAVRSEYAEDDPSWVDLGGEG